MVESFGREDLMKSFFIFSAAVVLLFSPVFASSMFDDDGNYTGKWKQMTNVSSSGSSSRYNSSNYSSSAWYINNNKQRTQNKKAAYTNQNVHNMDVMPFRYNTLDYTRVRKVKGGYGEYSARCSDIGDVSFCH